MQFSLLTHSDELGKASNTGNLVLRTLEGITGSGQPRCRRILWQRKAPDAQLLEDITSQPTILVYPAGTMPKAVVRHDTLSFTHFVLIDATWQQAQKMLNQSPYLFHLPRLSLAAGISQYRLRRNQRGEGLCTSETAAHLLRLNGQPALAQRLDRALTEHQML